MNTQQDVIAALRKGEVDTAMDRARLLTEAAPDDSTSYRLLAVAQAAVGDLASAHSSLDRALQLAPDDATLHYQRATFFVGERRSDATREVLGRAVEIDPNEIRVYLLRAQLALWDRDIEQAESELRFAERLDSGHPVALTLRGVCLLWRRHLDDAVELLSRAVRIAPENPQARYALGLAYLAKSHFAFAEQAFRSILEQLPGLHAARRLLADALRQQGRLAEAADILVAGPRVEVPVDMLRHAAGLWSEAGEPGKALDVLKRAASIAPRDGRVLDALIAALRLRGDAAHAREVVETALLSAPEIDGLWSARLSFEPTGGDLKAIADRWLAAIPGSIPALHLQMWLAERDGRLDDAVKLADRILAADQTHFEANVVRIRDLFLQDPNAAVAHLDHLLTQVSDERTRRMVLGWRGRALDKAGRRADAVANWRSMQSLHGSRPVELPKFSQRRSESPPGIAGGRKTTEGPIFVYGPPGSGVERVIGTVHHSVGSRVRMDRMEPHPPEDLLQSADTPLRLERRELSTTEVAASWRRGLTARRVDEARIIDWLPFWDQALEPLFFAELANAQVWLILADPRDMFLDWLQRGTYLPYRVPSLIEGATWLARLASQLDPLVNSPANNCKVLKIDDTAHDARSLAQRLSRLAGADLAPLRSLGPERFPAGHWRRYAEVLAGPFAQLTPVAMRLGYPET